MLVGGIGGVCAMGSAVLCSCGAGSHREQFVCLSVRPSVRLSVSSGNGASGSQAFSCEPRCYLRSGPSLMVRAKREFISGLHLQIERQMSWEGEGMHLEQ